MNVNKIQDGKNVTFEVEGRLDTITAPDMDEQLNEVIDDVENITFDFKNLEYISSAGLRILLNTHKELGKRGTMKILNANEDIMEIFELTGFDNIFTIV